MDININRYESQIGFKNTLIESLMEEFNNFIELQLKNIGKEEISIKIIIEEANKGLFIETINGLSNVVSYYPNDMLIWLVNWHLLKSESIQNITGTIKENIASFKELIDGAYLYCLKEFLSSVNIPLDRGLVHNITNSVFNIFKEYTQYQIESKKDNFNLLISMAQSIMDIVASRNLNDLQLIFFQELDNNTNHSLQTWLIMIMSNIQTKVYSIDHVESVFLFIDNCGKRLVKCKDKEIRFSYITMITKILFSFAATAKTELNIPIVKNTIECLYTHALDMVKRYKHPQICIPYITSLLCCTNKAFFFNNYYSFFQSFLQYIKIKDITVSRLVVECLDKIIWVYMVRFKCEESEKTLKFINMIFSSLFCNTKTALFNEFPDIYIKIIESIHQARPGYALKNIIYELCQSPTIKQFSLEKMYIGIRAYMLINDPRSKTTFSSFLPLNDSLYQTTRFTTIKKALTSKEHIANVPNYIEARTILINYIQTIWHLDSIFGRAYLNTNPVMSQKYSSDLLNNEKKLKIGIFRHLITLLPKFSLVEEYLEEICDFLTRLTLHIDSELQSRANAVIKVLVVEYPSLRSNILTFMTRTYLREIPPTCFDVMESALNNFLKLVQICRACLSNESNEEKQLEGYCVIDGFCLICLCSPIVKHRELSFLIMKESRQILSYIKVKNNFNQSVYDELYRFLTCHVSTKLEEYNLPDIMKLVELNYSRNAWFHAYGVMLRDSKIAQKCGFALNFARIYGLFKFVTTHNQLETSSNYVDTGSRLTLGKTKKLPSYCDTQSWQTYFIIFASPPYIEMTEEERIRLITNSVPEATVKNSIYNNIIQVFETVPTLIKAEFVEIREMCCDALCLTNSNIVPIFIKSILPLLKECIEQRPDHNSKKKKKRDIIIIKILNIFSNIAQYNNLTICFESSQHTTIIQQFLEYCEECKNNILPAIEPLEVKVCAQIKFAKIFTSICNGLYNSNSAYMINATSRELYYREFCNWLDNYIVISINSSGCSSSKENIEELDYRQILREAIFSILYYENLLTNNSFKVKIAEILPRINFNNLVTNDPINILIIDVINILLLCNEYISELIDWVFNHVYISNERYSRKFFFILLNFFEKKEYLKETYIRILTMIFIHIYTLNSVFFMRIVKTFNYLEKKYSTCCEKYNLSLNHHQQNDQCLSIQNYIFEHLKNRCNNLLIPLMSELFKVFFNCDTSYRVYILSCLNVIFKRLCICNTPEFLPSNLGVLISDSLDVDPIYIDFEIVHLTFTFITHHQNYIKDCWLSLISSFNSNFVFLLHYLLLVAHYECENIQSLIKIVIEFISKLYPQPFYQFILYHLITEQDWKIRVEFIKKYPYVHIFDQTNLNKCSTEKKLISLKLSNNNTTTVLSCCFGEVLTSSFYCANISSIMKYSTKFSLPIVLLIFTSYALSISSIMIDSTFAIFLHLAINEILNPNEVISDACRNILIHLCSMMADKSDLPSSVKSSILAELITTECILNFPTSSNILSLRKNILNDVDSIKVVFELSNMIESINNKTAICESLYYINSQNVLSSLLEIVLSYITYCNFSDFIHNYWCQQACYFATKYPSISVRFYSLFVIRKLNTVFKLEAIRTLINCYCGTLNDSSIEVKKFSYELSITIYSLSSNLITKILSDDIFSESADTSSIITAYIWFFTHDFIFDSSNNFHTDLSFFNQLLTLPHDKLTKYFDNTFRQSDIAQKYLIFIIANNAVISSSLQEQCILLLIQLSQFQSQFVSPDISISRILVVIIMAYYYLDFFDGPFYDLTQSFNNFIDAISHISSFHTFYNIFNMFRPANKRKDNSLFLNMLMPEIISCSNKYVIFFICRVLTDIISISEFRCLRNGLHLLHSLIHFIGKHNIPLYCMDFLLNNLPNYIKDTNHCKIAYEISRQIFSSSQQHIQLCPHQYVKHRINNLVINCSCDTLTDSSFVYCDLYNRKFFCQQDIKLHVSNIYHFFECSPPTDDAHLFCFRNSHSDLSHDYDIRIHISYEEQNKIDNYSMNSSQMIDDIIETLNFLDSELDKNSTISGESSRKQFISTTLSKKTSLHSKSLQTLHTLEQRKEYAQYISAENLIPIEAQCVESDHLSSDDSPNIYDSKSTFNQPITPNVSNSTLTTNDSCMFDSSTLETSKLKSDSSIQNLTFDQLSIDLEDLFFVLYSPQKDVPLLLFSKSIHTLIRNNNFGTDLVTAFFTSTLIIPIIIYKCYNMFHIFLNDVITNDRIIRIVSCCDWIKNIVQHLNKQLYDNLSDIDELPQLIINSDIEYVKKIISRKFLTNLIKIYSSSHRFFTFYQLFNNFVNNSTTFTEEYIQNILSYCPNYILFESIYNDDSNSKQHTKQFPQDFHLKFIFNCMLELMSSLIEIFDSYSLYIDHTELFNMKSVANNRTYYSNIYQQTHYNKLSLAAYSIRNKYKGKSYNFYNFTLNPFKKSPVIFIDDTLINNTKKSDAIRLLPTNTSNNSKKVLIKSFTTSIFSDFYRSLSNFSNNQSDDRFNTSTNWIKFRNSTVIKILSSFETIHETDISSLNQQVSFCFHGSGDFLTSTSEYILTALLLLISRN